MDINLLTSLTSKVEKNMAIIENAFAFVDNCPETKASNEQHSSVADDFDNVKAALAAYMIFEGNIGKLSAFLSEKVLPSSRNLVNYQTLLSEYIQYNKRDPIAQAFEFHRDADKVVKEVDAQLQAICEMLSISFPAHPLLRAANNHSCAFWGHIEFFEALNIVAAAKSLIS